MDRNTPEYRAILKANESLTRALMNNFIPICAKLVANDLITPDQQRKLRNPNQDAMERAAELVQLLTDKVEENPANYHTLVKILEKDRATYRGVLADLALPSGSAPATQPGMATTTPGRPEFNYAYYE